MATKEKKLSGLQQYLIDKLRKGAVLKSSRRFGGYAHRYRIIHGKETLGVNPRTAKAIIEYLGKALKVTQESILDNSYRLQESSAWPVASST